MGAQLNAATVAAGATTIDASRETAMRKPHVASSRSPGALTMLRAVRVNRRGWPHSEEISARGFDLKSSPRISYYIYRNNCIWHSFVV
jgi:hypothetical protein